MVGLYKGFSLRVTSSLFPTLSCQYGKYGDFQCAHTLARVAPPASQLGRKPLLALRAASAVMSATPRWLSMCRSKPAVISWRGSGRPRLATTVSPPLSTPCSECKLVN
jgi:hypothetical protein